MGNKMLEGVEHFGYLGTTLTSQNFISEEIQSRLKSENVCNHSVQNICIPFFYPKIQRSRYTELYFIFSWYGCLTLSFILREEHRLRLFEHRVLRRKFGIKKEKVTGEWRRLHDEELYSLYTSPNIIQMITSKRFECAEHVWGTGEVSTRRRR